MVSNDNLIAAVSKGKKIGYIISYNKDSLIYHIENFELIVFLVLKEDSQVSIQISSTSKIITTD